MSQLAFDLDDVAPEVPPRVIARPPDGLPDLDREAAVAKLASLIARHHASEGATDDNE